MLREVRASSICDRVPEQADTNYEWKHGADSTQERLLTAERVHENGKSPRLTIF